MAMYLDDVEVKKETAAALLIEYAGEDYWLPKSQIVFDESDARAEGDRGTIAITDWIAREKGLA